MQGERAHLRADAPNPGAAPVTGPTGGLTSRPEGECGHSLVEVVAGVVLLSLVIFTLYHVFLPTLALSRNTSERLDRQQDVRLAIDRMARDLHETAAGQIVVYGKESGCTGAYQGCIGFVSPRANCSGEFQLASGFPRWQAVIYVWRAVGANELRRLCDTSTTFAAATWPPKLAAFGHTVIGTRVTEAAFFLQPAGSPNPTSLAIMLREETDGASSSARRYQTEYVSQTILLPQNR